MATFDSIMNLRGADKIKSGGTQFFEVNVTSTKEAALETIQDMVDGDIAVLKETIAEGSDKSSMTAYVYDKKTDSEGVWKALDGNYDASNVYFGEDLTYTSNIGALPSVPSTGSATIDSSGKSVLDVLKQILAKEINPTVDRPSATFTVSGGSAEVGSSFTAPTATYKVTDIGSYSYGGVESPGSSTKTEKEETGVVFPAQGISISCTQGGTATNSNQLVKNGTVTLQATNNQGGLYTDTPITFNFSITKQQWDNPSTIVPVTNIGTEKPDLKLTYQSSDKPTTNTSITATFTGYRCWFIGKSTETSDAIDSTLIRGLTNKGNSNSVNTIDNYAIEAGTKRVIVAIPVGKKSLTKVTDIDGMGLDIIDNFKKSTIKVSDARGETNGQIDYNVWVNENAEGLAATKYKFEFA